MTNEVPVTQADRDAAADCPKSLWELCSCYGSGASSYSGFICGECGGAGAQPPEWLLTMLARHRLASEQPRPSQDVVEAAKPLIFAVKRTKELDRLSPDPAGKRSCKDMVLTSELERLAEALEALSPHPEPTTDAGLAERLEKALPLLDDLETGQECEDYAFAKGKGFQAMTYCPDAFEALRALPDAIAALRTQPVTREGDAVEALADLTDAFLSRHGCFPLGQTNNMERHWHRAMKRAYEIVGRPNTPEREAALSRPRTDAPDLREAAGKAFEALIYIFECSDDTNSSKVAKEAADTLASVLCAAALRSGSDEALLREARDYVSKHGATTREEQQKLLARIDARLSRNEGEE